MGGASSGESETNRLPPMARYVLGLLRRPPAPPPRTAAEAERLQEAHLAYLRTLRESGELITCGPMLEDVDLRGVLVFRTDSIDRARQLMRDDPLLGGGFLRLELFTWFAPAGLTLAGEGPPPATGLTFETD